MKRKLLAAAFPRDERDFGRLRGRSLLREFRPAAAAIRRGRRGSRTRVRLDRWLLELDRRQLGLGRRPLDAPAASRRDVGCAAVAPGRPPVAKRAGLLAALAGGLAYCPRISRYFATASMPR